MNNFSYILSVEPTPNENSYKFTINHDFAGDIMWEGDSLESVSESELAENIWQIGNIDQVFFHSTIVVVHKAKVAEWDALIPSICQKINQHFQELRPLFKENNDTTNPAGTQDERLDLLRQLISDYIQPGLMSHGGFVRLVGLQENTLKLSMHGACNGCSSADVTLENGIKRLINFYYPEMQVELVK